MAKCEHGKERTGCRNCLYAGTGGGSFCPHERIRHSCSLCSPETIYAKYKAGAIKRGLLFTLSLEEFQDIVSQECVWCGQRPAMGIDRRNNFYGYSIGNAASCCWRCNARKKEMPEDEFKAWVLKVAGHLRSKNETSQPSAS